MNEQNPDLLYEDQILQLTKIVDAIKSSDNCTDEENFREMLINEIDNLRNTLNQTIDHQIADKIIMAVCALLDEIIINKISNIYESWISFSLQGKYFNRTDCGTLISDDIQNLSQNDEILLNKTIMYFYYWCLKLGFLGSFSTTEATKLILIYENKLKLNKKTIPFVNIKQKPSFLLGITLYVVMTVLIISCLFYFHEYLRNY